MKYLHFFTLCGSGKLSKAMRCSCCARQWTPAVYVNQPMQSMANVAASEVWYNKAYAWFQWMKIQTWCEIGASSPLALSWNEWFINKNITDTSFNWFQISKHLIGICDTLCYSLWVLDRHRKTHTELHLTISHLSIACHHPVPWQPNLIK